MECIGQKGNGNYPFWYQRSLSGSIGVKAEYRNQRSVLGSGFEENLKGSLFSGGLLLKSSSFIIHPNLMGLDIDIEYNPEKIDDQYMVSPDRSEVRTLKRLNVNSTFFQEKEITLSGFVNLDQNYTTRENLTNIRTNRKFFGGSVFYKNIVLPASLTYQEGSWDQAEIGTQRTYSYWQRNIKGRIAKSFSSKDKHEFTYSYDDFIREEFYTNPRQNVVNDAKLNSRVYFDSQKKFSLNTVISNMNQAGTDEFNRFQIFGNLYMNLPQNFRLMGNYNFYDHQDPLYRLDQHRAKFELGHQLFSSLESNIFAEYTYSKHTVYQENDSKIGFNIKYTKKIPIGMLNISYFYYNRNFNRKSESVSLKIINEQHVVTDGQITLLDKPYADMTSVVIKDITGTIIYQLNFDYLLFEQNNFIEIQRIPGGQIPNSSTILVDYTTLMPGSYKYNLNNQSFMISALLFKRFIELYYRRARQDYNNVDQSEFVALNYYSQNIYGIRFTKSFARFGVEYDDYNSSIVPYKLLHYYADLQWKFRNKLLLSLIGNIRDYIIIGDRKNELYADISARAAYSFNTQMKLNMEFTYREQDGYQIDLNLLTARTEFTMKVRKLFFTISLDVYRRNYLNRETLDFNRANFSVERKF